MFGYQSNLFVRSLRQIECLENRTFCCLDIRLSRYYSRKIDRQAERLRDQLIDRQRAIITSNNLKVFVCACVFACAIFYWIELKRKYVKNFTLGFHWLLFLIERVFCLPMCALDRVSSNDFDCNKSDLFDNINFIKF